MLLALVVPSLIAVSWVGGRGMAEMKARLDAVYEDNLTSTRAIGSLSVALQQAEQLSLRLIADPGGDRLEGRNRSRGHVSGRAAEEGAFMNSCCSTPPRP
jgi:hypothetical protein